VTTTAADDEIRLYEDFAANRLIPLWTAREDLMPSVPNPSAVPHIWHWTDLYPLAQRAGELIPVGRGGERRAIAIANPGLIPKPYATPTLWAAIQYLGPGEVAPRTGTARTPSASSSKVKAYGRSSTAIRWRCAAVIC
jgi:gentisate 1,2-dioxygenase